MKTSTKLVAVVTVSRTIVARFRPGEADSYCGHGRPHPADARRTPLGRPGRCLPPARAYAWL